MTVLVLAIITLSIADLVVTLTHLTTIGMIESNPIAVWLIVHTRSPWVLGAFKIGTVGVCVMILYRARRHVQSEIAAWVGVGILSVLAWKWFLYSQHIDDVAELRLVQSEAYADLWLRLE